MKFHLLRWGISGLLCLGFVGCSGSSSEPVSSTPEPEAPMPVARAIDGEPEISITVLRERLGADSQAEFTKAGGRVIAANLADSGVKDLGPLKGLPLKYLDLTFLPISDLSPLAGMPLEELYLEQTQVADITPLQGMPLRILRMEETQVADLTPLAGMKLIQLNLLDTPVQDITVIKGMPLQTLWLTGSQVEDLAVLQGMPLESLDIERTKIADLSPLAGNRSLRRLNIAQSGVTDLTPLTGMRLERLILTVENIKTGLEIVQTMPTLQQLGPSFEEVTSAEEFWTRWAAQPTP